MFVVFIYLHLISSLIYTGSEIPKLSTLRFTKPLLFMLFVGFNQNETSMRTYEVIYFNQNHGNSNKGVMRENLNYFSHFLNFWVKKDMNENSL